MPVLDKPNIFGLTTKIVSHTEPIPAKKTLIELKKLLIEERSDEVIKKGIDIALTDGHPFQGGAIKLLWDRMLPVSEFENNEKGGIKTVIIDRSCGGKVIIKTGGSTVEMETEDYMTLENGENNG